MQLDSIYSSIAEIGTNKPNLNLVDFKSISSKSARVALASVKPFNNLDDLIDTFNERFPKLVLHENTVVQSETLADGRVYYEAIACVQQETRAFLPGETIEGFTAVASTSNLFLDSEDKIWGVEGTGEYARLVKHTEDDITGLLQARKVRDAFKIKDDRANAGRIIAFYNPETQQVDVGVDLGGMVVTKSFTQKQKLLRCQVIAHLQCSPRLPDAVRQQAYEVLSTSTNMDLAPSRVSPTEFGREMLDYYRQLFGNHPFIKQLKEELSKQGLI